MRFQVSRTSEWYGNKPCEEAYRQKIIRIDERGFETFEEHDKTLTRDKKWIEEGFNHAIVPANEQFKKPHIYREFEDYVWAIDIDTLEDLLKFKEKYGDLVITTSIKNEYINEIEIYDDWRE